MHTPEKLPLNHSSVFPLSPKRIQMDIIPEKNVTDNCGDSTSGKAAVEHYEFEDNPHHNYRAKGNVEDLLAPLSHEQLAEQVNSFVDEYDLDDIRDTMHRGALFAKHPNDYADVPGITEEDKKHVDFEYAHKWRQPWEMYVTIVLTSIGACVQGWDQTGSAGANLSFPQLFGLPINNPDDPNYDHNNWMVGLINGAPYLTAFSLGSFLTDPVNHFVGRRGCLFLAAIFCLVSPIGAAFCRPKWYQLFACRLLLGLGIGFKETTAPILAAENAPTPIRGALVMMWQLWTAFGICIGYAANLVVYKVWPHNGDELNDKQWRFMLGSAFIPAVPLIILIYFVPESPRWYIKRRRIRSAYKSLVRLRHTEVQACRDLFRVYISVVEEEAVLSNHNAFQRVCQLFYKNRLRQTALAVFVVMISQQMCGINIMAFYSSSIFEEINNDSEQAILASFGFGLVNWIFAIPAIYTIDTFGRRNLLLFTFPNMFWTLLAAGLSYLAVDDRVRLGLVSLFVYLFTVFYSPGGGPVPFTYSAEAFPLSHREFGMAWGVFVNNFFAFILSLTFFRLKAALSVTGAFGFYAGLNLLAWVWIFLWVRETAGISLEDLDHTFSIPTGEFMNYQLTVWLPWFCKRYILFQKHTVTPPSVLETHRRRINLKYAKESSV